jgi:hypothetical protein
MEDLKVIHISSDGNSGFGSSVECQFAQWQRENPGVEITRVVSADSGKWFTCLIFFKK